MLKLVAAKENPEEMVIVFAVIGDARELVMSMCMQSKVILGRLETKGAVRLENGPTLGRRTELPAVNLSARLVPSLFLAMFNPRIVQTETVKQS